MPQRKRSSKLRCTGWLLQQVLSAATASKQQTRLRNKSSTLTTQADWVRSAVASVLCL
jgi:hypothetical protein